MRGRLPALLATALIGVTLWSGLGDLSDNARALTNCDTNAAETSGTEAEVLRLVNANRTAAGLSELIPSPGLSRGAAWKSEDRQTSFGAGLSHTDSLGRDPSARAQDCGYPGRAAENIAYGYPTPQAVVDAWMSSPGHRANILMSYYVVAGVGYSDGAWTIDFGIVNDSGSSSPAPPPPATPTPSATPTPARTAPPPPPQPTSTPVPEPPPANVLQAAPAAPASGVVVQLGAGVNLVTYVGLRQPASQALASLREVVVDVYRWDTASGGWQRYVPGNSDALNGFSEMAPGEAYFIRLAGPGAWIY